MDTPSSMRRITRSQASAAASRDLVLEKIKQEETLPRSRNALLDITNDSPIVGLAATGAVATTPSSIKMRVAAKRTPGSGEALLSGQVKTLLQKVDEEEAQTAVKVSSGGLPPLRAVMGLSIPDVKEGVLMVAMMPTLVEEDPEKQDEQLNRALFFDSPSSSSSALSIHVNASSQADDEEEYFDHLCEGMMKMSVADDVKIGLPEFGGKHTRFVYNSDDDEIEGEEEVGESCMAASPSVLVLKGLPAPEGKHLRFQEEVEEN